MRFHPALFGLIFLAMTACHRMGDDEDYSARAYASAGEVISLKHQASEAPGTTYRMAYRSTDAHLPHQLVAVSATVIVPYGRPPSGGWPIVAWAHGTSGLAITCAPSIMGIGGPQASFYGAWIRRGFAVVGTDFPGLGEAGTPLYLNSRSEGMAVLDSVRAATRAVRGLSDRVVLLGHDQGAHAVIAAAGMAAGYTPELQILGTIAVGAPDPANDPQFFSGVHGESRFSPNVFYALMMGASLGRADSQFIPERAFTDRAMELYGKASRECRSDVFAAMEHRRLTPANAFAPGVATALKPALDWSRYPTLALKQPLMLAIGGGDTQIPLGVQERLGQNLCAAGTPVSVYHYAGAEHTPVLHRAQMDALDFADGLLSGRAPASTCHPG